MRKAITAVLKRATRARAKWLLRTHAQSWAIQGGLILALTAGGIGTVAAVVSAKAAAYAVFAVQCVKAARSTQAE